MKWTPQSAQRMEELSLRSCRVQWEMHSKEENSNQHSDILLTR